MTDAPVVPVAPVVPRPAATVVLLRPGPAGLEALLTHRPATMAFAPDVHVFPGGRVDAGDADPALAARSMRSAFEAADALGGDLEPEPALAAHVAAVRELFEEAGVLLADTSARPDRVAAARTALLAGATTFAAAAAELDLRLRTDRLVALSRWVTPPTLPRRFDARFFAAALPDETTATFEGGEVVAHDWQRPGDALAAMAAGNLALWLPTSSTLQQLEHAPSLEAIRTRLAAGRLGGVEVEVVSPEVTRVVMPAGGGVAGQPVCAYLVGHRRFVLVDPGDPTGPGIDRALALAARDGGAIEAVALTHVDPDHAAGAEAVAEILGVPIVVGPGGGRSLPYEVRELADGAPVPGGDVPLRAITTPGPRADHVAFADAAGRFVLTGDLDGRRGARSITGPLDAAALDASRVRIRRLAPGTTWLGGHPEEPGAAP